MMSLFAGRNGVKALVIAGIVLAVGLTSWYVIRSIQQATEDKITIELQESTNTKRKEVRDAVKERRNTPSGDGSWGLRYFESRQGD